MWLRSRVLRRMSSLDGIAWLSQDGFAVALKTRESTIAQSCTSKYVRGGEKSAGCSSPRWAVRH